MGSQNRAASPVIPTVHYYQAPTITFDPGTGLTTETPAASAQNVVSSLKDRFEKIATQHQAGQAVLNGVHAPHPVRPVKITGADNGKTIAVRENGSFTISLREIPPTGYVWNVVPGSRALGMPSSKFVSDAHESGMVGVGGVRSFTWKTSPMVGANSGTVIPVHMVEKRPWEAGNSETFSVNIKII